MEEKIRQEEIYYIADNGLFIRGIINKPSRYEQDQAKIYLLSGRPSVLGEKKYVEYRYEYKQLKPGRDFAFQLEQKIFVSDEYIDTLGILRVWGLDVEEFEKIKPEIIIAKITNSTTEFVGTLFQHLPLTDPAVIVHLARLQGMIGQTKGPGISELGREQVFVRLGALITQQLKKWSQTIG